MDYNFFTGKPTSLFFYVLSRTGEGTGVGIASHPLTIVYCGGRYRGVARAHCAIPSAFI